MTSAIWLYMQTGMIITAGLLLVELLCGEWEKPVREDGIVKVVAGAVVLVWIGAVLWPMLVWQKLCEVIRG